MTLITLTAYQKDVIDYKQPPKQNNHINSSSIFPQEILNKKTAPSLCHFSLADKSSREPLEIFPLFSQKVHWSGVNWQINILFIFF